MRFEVSRVLDAIEQRLSTDPVLAGAILNVGEVLRAVELDGGRPAYLPRIGTVIDALARELGDATVPVYGVVDRALLSSLELTSNEKMVLRRWADDGVVEVIADMDPVQRMAELAKLTGLPVVSRTEVPGEGRWLAPMPGATGVIVVECRAAGDHQAPASVFTLWRCPDGEVVPLPVTRKGHPCCPRHGEPLVDEGARPKATAMIAWVGEVARQRFAVTEGNRVAVGRSPGGGIMLGPWLNDVSLPWISRVHVELSFTGGGQLTVTDRSTNGTVVVGEDGERIELTRDASCVVSANQIVELYRSVCVARPGWRPAEAPTAIGVMAEAPTIALRLPPLE